MNRNDTWAATDAERAAIANRPDRKPSPTTEESVIEHVFAFAR